MNKLVIALGLAASVAMVGCSKEKPPETGATTGEHLENAAQQAGNDVANATQSAATATANAADSAADNAATTTVDAAKDATVATAGAVEHGAAHVKEKAQQ